MYNDFEFAKFEKDYIDNIVSLGKPWNDDDNTIRDFKKKLDEKIRINKYCPYCRRRLKRKKFDELDHIIYKADYSHYTFQPLNIVISCKRCNNNKLNKNVLKDEYIELFKDLDWYDYPDNGIYYRIIHPYFDFYAEHIQIKKNIFYIPRNSSSKGFNTIEMMKLNNFDFLEERVKDSDSSQNIISKYVSSCDHDEQLIIWAKFLLEDHSFQEMLFDIFIDFENSDQKGIKLPQSKYNSLKTIIQNRHGRYTDKLEITFRANARFIKRINKINDHSIIQKAIDQLEELYKLRDLNASFEYSLFLSIIFLIKLKEGKYSKSNITKYLAV